MSASGGWLTRTRPRSRRAAPCAPPGYSGRPSRPAPRRRGSQSPASAGLARAAAARCRAEPHAQGQRVRPFQAHHRPEAQAAVEAVRFHHGCRLPGRHGPAKGAGRRPARGAADGRLFCCGLASRVRTPVANVASSACRGQCALSAHRLPPSERRRHSTRACLTRSPAGFSTTGGSPTSTT